jgi:hypothetical protein
MADGNNNPNQKNENQKPGLSWTQPASGANANQSKGNTAKPGGAVASTDTSDSTARVIGIIIGIVVIFALAAWGIVALHNRSQNTAGTTATTASSTVDTSNTDTTSAASAQGTDTTNSGTASDTQTSSDSQPATASGASFTIPSPQDAGSTVAVNDLSVTKPTWIIVYDTANGKPDRVLGASLFFAGDSSGIVQLLRSTLPGQKYLVTAAVDNGDKTFSVHGETPVADSSGSQMWITLQTR